VSGKQYVGDWLNNDKHGHGIEEFEDGSKYTGNF